jgi:peroxiredoxin
MAMKWVGAGVAALALAILTLPTFPAWDSASAADTSFCDANVKPSVAKLDHTLKDMHGKNVNLAAYKGKVIILDFWATWCGPCKVEIPGFVDLQSRYKDKGLVVLGVSVDDPIEKLKPFADQYKVNYPMLAGIGRDDFQDLYGPMFAVPTTFVIARDGKVCKRHTGMTGKDVFEREIRGLL